MKRFTIGTLLLFMGFNFLAAQIDSANVGISVRDLDFMVGEWEGHGWTMTRAGRSESETIEKVEYKLDSSIIVVEGLGTKTDSATQTTKVVHNAFGVIYCDRESNSLFMNAYKDGESTNSKIEFLEEKVIQWNLAIPDRGTVRFTVDFSDETKWIEIGEFSADGAHWRKFMGMELSRK